MADAKLVVDVRVRQTQVGDDEVSDGESLDLLGDDQCADVAVGAHGAVAEVLEHRLAHALPQGVGGNLSGDALNGEPRGLDREGHHHEGDRSHDTRPFAWKGSATGSIRRMEHPVRARERSTTRVEHHDRAAALWGQVVM